MLRRRTACARDIVPPKPDKRNPVRQILIKSWGNGERLHQSKARHRGAGRRPGDIAARPPHPNLRRDHESRARHGVPLRTRNWAALAGGDRFCFLSLSRDRSYRVLPRVHEVSGRPRNFQPHGARRLLCWAVWVVRSKLVLESTQEKSKPLTTLRLRSGQAPDTKVHKGNPSPLMGRTESLNRHGMSSGGFSFVYLCVRRGSWFSS